jgi:hypothetical protein
MVNHAYAHKLIACPRTPRTKHGFLPNFNIRYIARRVPMIGTILSNPL